MTTALTQGLERIPDQLGYLVISDGAVLASSGDLENDEQTAAVLSELVATACGLRLQRGHDPPFKRLSVVFGEHSLQGTPPCPHSGVWGALPPGHHLWPEALRGEAPEPRPGACHRLSHRPAAPGRAQLPPRDQLPAPSPLPCSRLLCTPRALGWPRCHPPDAVPVLRQ
ncbi:ragulator complex protein LAMTOR4 isoform X2 [Melanerpes formicivorus]|uniref:ragulator complex protein LAMTOR4 isoform X2 n=1 Tax=Melanerpes formicivorus TaxID=211600 RepID=UPI00358F9AEB